MKKTLLFTTSILIGLLLLTYPEVINGNVNGSNNGNGGKTNSPIDGGNCTGCHGGTINSGQGSVAISSDIPAAGYVPGETYTITVTASHPSFTTYGFELTAENGSSKAGSFIITNSSQTQLCNGGQAVTHKIQGTLGSATKTWTIDWIAPGFASSLGTVDFYVCALTGNGDGDNSGDKVHTNIYTVTEQQINSIQEKEQLFSVFYSDGRINIDASNTIERITIYNTNGQLVKSINSDSKIISTSDLSEGNYIVELSDVLNNKSTTKVNIY